MVAPVVSSNTSLVPAAVNCTTRRSSGEFTAPALIVALPTLLSEALARMGAAAAILVASHTAALMPVTAANVGRTKNVSPAAAPEEFVRDMPSMLAVVYGELPPVSMAKA